jgi:uncharacterized protein (TIGR03437 family)
MLAGNATAGVDGTPAQVIYVGPQSQYPGLGQVNVMAPAGPSSTVSITVDFQTSNSVTVQP